MCKGMSKLELVGWVALILIALGCAIGIPLGLHFSKKPEPADGGDDSGGDDENGAPAPAPADKKGGGDAPSTPKPSAAPMPASYIYVPLPKNANQGWGCPLAGEAHISVDPYENNNDNNLVSSEAACSKNADCAGYYANSEDALSTSRGGWIIASSKLPSECAVKHATEKYPFFWQKRATS